MRFKSGCMEYLAKNIANYYNFGIEYLLNLASNHDIKLYLFIITAVSKNFINAFTINSLGTIGIKNIISLRRLIQCFYAAARMAILDRFFEIWLGNLQINLGSFDARVTKQLLDGRQLGPIPQQMSCKRVS